MYKIGLIGNGAFGKALTGWLTDECRFAIHDKNQGLDTAETALDQPIVIFNIPAQNMEEFLVSHQSLLRPDALYIDVCSVKVNPVQIMHKYLPSGAEIIATHPLFGPQSAKQGVAGHKIMVHNVRASAVTYQQFSGFLDTLGLRVFETTPEAHDQAIAYAQGLSHFIGRVMKEMKIPESELATQAYEDLLDMMRIQGNDSDALFESIVHDNPYSQQILAEFADASLTVSRRFRLDA